MALNKLIIILLFFCSCTKIEIETETEPFIVMDSIIAGMTPAEFLTAVNNNFAYVPGTIPVLSTEDYTEINDNYTRVRNILPTIVLTDLVAGITGQEFIDQLNDNFKQIENYGFVVEVTFANPGQYVALPLLNNANCPVHNFTVDWGDSSALGTVTSYLDPDGNHTYTDPGVYQIRITGICNSFYCAGADLGTPPDVAIRNYITKVISWGNVQLMACNFGACGNLTEIADDDFGGFYKMKFLSYFLRFTKVATLPPNLFKYGGEILLLSQAFAGTDQGYYSGYVNNIPDGFFDACVKATSMFGLFQCSNVKRIPPGLFDHCTQVNRMDFMFKKCAIPEIPEGLLDHNTKLTTIREMFFNINATSFPDRLLYNCPLLDDVAYMFSETQITTVHKDFFINNPLISNVEGMFWRTPSLLTVPGKLFDNKPLLAECGWMFEDCVNLQSIPADIFADSPNIIDLQRCFRNCTSATGNAPDLWNTNPTANHPSVFQNDLNLSNYASIPADWK